MFSSLRLSERLALAFGIVIVLMGVTLGFMLLETGRANAHVSEMVVEQAERLALAREWKENIVVNSQRALAMGLSSDNSLGAHFNEQVKAVTTRTTEIQKRYAELETTPEGKALQDRLGETRKRYFSQRDLLLNARGDAAKVASEGEAFKRVTTDYIAVANEMVAFQTQRQAKIADAVQASMSRVRWVASVVTLASVVLAAWLGWATVRSLTQPLQALRRTAQRVAAGDLTENLAVRTGRDETVQLANDIATMQGALRQLVRQVRESTDSIETASREVAAGNTDLSVRTERTASSLQEAASTMHQLTGAVRQSADAAHTADGVAQAAADVARRGGGVVQDVVRTMDDINAASRKISDIIGTIDGIAFQTNILALNAAVEAARAGEQGRGFAVVASEVRSLAQRSAEAAREIKSLIGNSVERVESGSALVGQAGQTMAEIVSSVQRVTDMVNQISVATAEQSQGINGVNGSVAQIEQTTQQNAALVEQSAAAAASLQEQAQRLASVVAGFKL